MSTFSIDFSKRDYDSLVSEADRLATLYLPEWTARDDKDLNWVALKLACSLLAIGNVYVDLAYNEQDPYSVQIYKNALRLARARGMRVKIKKGCTSTVKITIDVRDVSFTLDRLTTKFIGYNNMPYVLTEDVTILAGDNKASATVIYGEYKVGTLSTADGSEFPVFTLDVENVCDSQVKLYTLDLEGNKVYWNEVDTFIYSTPTSKDYKLLVNDDGKYLCYFGDGTTGYAPADGEVIYYEVITLPTTYATNNYGLAESGTITKCNSSDVISLEHTDTVSGGDTGETTKEIGYRIPQFMAASFRAVTNEDYAFLAKQVAGVQEAKVTNEESGFRRVLVVPKVGDVASEALRTEVYNYINARKVDKILFEVLNPTAVPINVEVSIKVRPTASNSKIKAIVTSALTEGLTRPEDISLMVSLMSVYDIVADAKPDMILSANIIKLYRNDSLPGLADIQLQGDEVATPGTVTVTVTGGGV